VIIPAFGTTLEIEALLHKKGIQTEKYQHHCPFVEKVWNRSEVIAKKNYTIVIHGKPKHEETRATFSHAASNAPSVVVKDMKEAKELAKYITGEKLIEEFYTAFAGQYSKGFDVKKDLQRIGVVNQTTMLASDTQAIADFLKQTIQTYYGLNESTIEERFADTRDTLCYATNDNQTAVTGMLQTKADWQLLSVVIIQATLPILLSYVKKNFPPILSAMKKKLFQPRKYYTIISTQKKKLLTANYLPEKKPLKILITSGASCPDALVEGVIRKLAGYFESENKID
jgi:4-hydroxy-3-methylbut-2-enyl diphosphate reductase